MSIKIKFILRITFLHIITYVLCGILFSNLFDYRELFELENVAYFMHEYGSSSNLLGPFIQIIRGVLLALVLLIVHDSIWGKKLAWLRLWFLLVVLGIISTYSAAPSSIEGFVYTQLPLEFHLKGLPEVLIQILLFSVLATNTFKIKDSIKASMFITILSAVLFSVSGIILSLLLNVGIVKNVTDIGAFVIMALSLVLVFIFSKLYYGKKIKTILYYVLCYIVLAGFPTIYNYLSGSLLASPLSLIISAIPVLAIYLYNRFKSVK